MGLLNWFTPQDQRDYDSKTASFTDYGVTGAQLAHARRLELDGADDPSKIPAASCMRDLRYGRLDESGFQECARVLSGLKI